MRSLITTIRFIAGHPLNRGSPLKALSQFVRWQIGTRLLRFSVSVPFVDDSRLLVAPGMTGATGNVYTGLHEYEDMAFVLHSLRPGDLFVDIGANVGSYTVLAGAVCKAHVIAVEPVPSTFEMLLDNLQLNRIVDIVEAERCGVAASAGELYFTNDLDTMNHVVAASHPKAVQVPVRSLDELLAGRSPFLIKVDVEGFEHEVLAGGRAAFSAPTLKAVIIEANGSASRYAVDPYSVHNQLTGFGLSAYSYDPASRILQRTDDVVGINGNILYLRDAAALQDRLATAPLRAIRGARV